MPMTSVRMTDEMQLRLDQLADNDQRSRSWEINTAVKEYVERRERELQMLAETRDAMKDVENNQIIDGDKVNAWLESWGSDDELAPPRV
jgi:predicted transcriptional regulator